MSTSKSMRWGLSSQRVCLPDGVQPALLFVESGRIVKVVKTANFRDSSLIAQNDPVEDLGDLVVAPGLIDSHVHINEPGRTEWEGFRSATLAAAAGGVTTLIDMPLNSSPVTTTAAHLEAKRNAAQSKCSVNVRFYGGLVPDNLADLPDLLDAGVCGLKAFLCDSGLDEFPASTELELRAALPLLRERGLPLLVHAELVGESNPIRDVQSYAQYAASRPAAWEVSAIRLLVKLCREFRTPIHIVHLATAEALPIIDDARSEGLPITVETCPHYLWFCAEEIPSAATQYKCAPPIRDSLNRQQLCAALAAGQLDTVGSDHSPCPPELKQLKTGNFPQAWGGIASLQLTLPVMWTLAKRNGWTIHQIVQWSSARPAEIFGLGSKGRLAVGYDADISVWDPDKQWTVCAEQLHHRHPFTPYDRETLHGLVQKTFVGGRMVFDQGNVEPFGDGSYQGEVH